MTGRCAGADRKRGGVPRACLVPRRAAVQPPDWWRTVQFSGRFGPDTSGVSPITAGTGCSGGELGMRMRIIGRPRPGRRRLAGLAAAMTVLASALTMSGSIAVVNPGGTGTHEPPVDRLSAPGAWLVAADGGVFGLGAASF